MNKFYNSRQQKIYEDYSGYSSDCLVGMVKSENYLDEVTNVVKDILTSRNVLIEEPEPKPLIALVSESKKQEIENDRIKKRTARKQEVEFYIKQLENSSDKDLADIITRYTGYQLPAVEAALITAEKRGTISPPEKKTLLAQIRKGFEAFNRKEEITVKEKIRKSSRQIQTGLVLTVIGIILTLWTSIHPVGGYSIVFFGCIISGIVLLYRGFFIDN